MEQALASLWAKTGKDGDVRWHPLIIGFPDDGSWKEVKHEKADDDEPGLHPTLVAQTRIGEPSVVAIALFPADSE